MTGYRARRNDLLHAAVDAGIYPVSAASIAKRTGLTLPTVQRALAGGHLSGRTMAILANTLGTDNLFEPANDDDGAALQAVQ